MPIATDDSRWPLVVDVMPTRVNREDLEAWGNHNVQRLRRRDQPHVLILDARQTSLLDPLLRKFIADWIREHSVALKAVRVATAMVTGSSVARGMLTAIDWLTPPQHARKVFSTMVEAETWAREMLASAK